MMRVGNQTACWAATPTEPFDYALAHAFDAFEWFPDKKPGAGWDETDLDRPARRQICERARAGGVRLSVHARWGANPLATDGAGVIEKDLELARDLGAVLLNLHFFHEQGPAAFIETILPLMRETAEAGLQLAIENTPEHSPEHFNDLFARLRSLTAPVSHVGMCFDLGHANLCSATLNDYLAFCDRLDPRVPIIHLHLHENWGDTDSHLPLFTGPASRDDAGIRGLITRLRQRRFSGCAILEQWPHPPSLLDDARDRLLALCNSDSPDRALIPKQEPPSIASPPNLNPDPDSAEAAPHSGSESPAAEEEPRPTRAETGFAAELARGDRERRSWREKLDFVRALLGREEPALTADQLIDIAIYLRFLGTGEIACAEDGRHFRPAHHARIASDIHQRLTRLTTPENAFIVRRIYPWLPSSAANFQRPEPLTRIRDIAHRSDIPQDLKREIKTTLQNKLHRCAGPEDLATSSALLERITAPGATYSPAFVEQFKTFHEELKEFFNARSLDAQLAALLPSSGKKQADLIRLFLRQKASHLLNDQIAAFRTLTTLREELSEEIARRAESEAPEVLLSDIALEDFAFVLLSQIINGTEKTDRATATRVQAQVLTLALCNLALSGVDPLESGAVAHEMRAWGELGSSAERDETLRLKATVLRCRRLAENFEQQTIALFSERAETLGRALGVAEHALRVFSEADIRSHLVFQVSKLASAVLRRIREGLGLPAWDVLVSGRAVGRVKMVDALDDLHGDSSGQVIVLSKTAAGDEEIPERVTAVVLAQEIPHLSHLAVRARQAGIVFVACEEAAEFQRLCSFEGQALRLETLPDKITWEKAATLDKVAEERPRPSPRIAPARLIPETPCIPLEQAVPENSGGKAAGARRMTELSRQAESGFLTPPALVVPFGVMEAGLAAAPDIAKEYRQWIDRLDRLADRNGRAPSAEFDAATQHLRELVSRIAVPNEIISQVRHTFAADARLIVRSSANCEDLEEYAGAGLYDSVLNVFPSDVSSAVRAVWSSLWTRRAALSRLEAGVPHDQAHMAVLIQEMLVSDFSFVLHTVNPVNHDPRQLYAEVVVGLGDTLASAVNSGTPYRLTGDKSSGEPDILSFANFSGASRPDPAGGVRRETLDYSQIDPSRQPEALRSLGRRLSAVGSFVEQALGAPQDIEGAVVANQIYLVQARSQPGLRC